MTSHAFDLTWGAMTFLVGGVVASNVWGAAERFQAMSYAYRSWPASVTTCRVIGAVFVIVGLGVLASAVL